MYEPQASNLGLDLRASRHITRRFLGIGLAVDAFFIALTVAAFTRLWGLADAPVRLVVYVAVIAHLVKEAIMAAVIVATLRPIERWFAAGDGADRPDLLARAGRAAYRAPSVIGCAWCIVWAAVYPIVAQVLTHLLPDRLPLQGDAMLATALLALGVSAAALSLSYTISGALVAPTAGAISLHARARGVTLGAEGLSLRARLAMLMVCLAIGPTTWMASIAHMESVSVASHPGQTATPALLLFALVASSWGPICAFFLTGALSRPLRNIGGMIEQIVRQGDPQQATLRTPVYYKDEIGRLAEGVNEMTDRLAESAARTEQHLVELDRAVRQAQDAVHVRDEFLSVAAHELRTPLTSLGLTIQSLGKRARGEGRPATPDELVAGFDLAMRQIRQFQKLVDGLLDVSRISEGRLRMEPEELDLAVLVREATARLAEDATRARCPLALRADAPIPGLWDPIRLEQIVTNLVSNAIKFGAGRAVELELSSDDQAARLRVTDHGIGIAPEDHERIFQRFERAVSIHRYGGLGLGLWITRQLVDAMGGRIQVASQSQEGATFTVELPRRAAGGS